MYQEIFESYRQEVSGFPKLRRALAGAVIKETRVDKGIRQTDFAREVGINEGTLKSIENDHQQATTVDNLIRCSKRLGISVDEIILLGREKDPANYFAFKRSAPPAIKGIRKRKMAPSEWHESLRLRFKNFDLTPISAPIATRKDFFLARINLPSKHSTEKLFLPARHPVLGFVASGFNIKIESGRKTVPLTTNQGFALNGYFPHTLINDDEEKEAVIYLLTKLPNTEKIKTRRPREETTHAILDVAEAIEKIRLVRSDRPERPIPIKHLADLTDSLNHEQIIKLMRIKKGSSVIYWEKIEDLLTAANVPMEQFLSWARHREEQSVTLASATSRAVIDYSGYYGIKIYSTVPAQSGNDFFCGEILLEGKASSGRKIWERKDNAMIALYVEEGEIEVTVGKKRSPLTLLKGESIYFDGNLSYQFRNPGGHQAKGFFAASPAISF